MSTDCFSWHDSLLLVGFLADDELGPELVVHSTTAKTTA